MSRDGNFMRVNLSYQGNFRNPWRDRCDRFAFAWLDQPFGFFTIAPRTGLTRMATRAVRIHDAMTSPAIFHLHQCCRCACPAAPDNDFESVAYSLYTGNFSTAGCF
jgi:hypothetical protein